MRRCGPALIVFLAAYCVLSLCACQRGLWADADPATERKIKLYYNGDSARETTESRKKTEGMGFGFPMGGGYQ